MVDANVRRFEEWEDVSSMTMAAVSGGVTLCVEERTDARMTEDFAPLFCDIGITLVLSPETRPESLSGSIAVKGYLTSPDNQIEPIGDLPRFLHLAHSTALPVIIDSTYIDSKIMIYSSPCRKLPLAFRISGEVTDHGDVLAGAMMADDKSSGSDEDSIDDSKKITRMESKPEDILPWANELSGLRSYRKRDRLKTYNQESTPTSTQPTLFSALSQEIYQSEASVATLVQAEIMAYRGTGQTLYSTHSALLPPCNAPNDKVSNAQSRRVRPSVISTVRPVAQPDTVYLIQLAQYPMNMESKGVEMVLKAIDEVPGSVHICNLASAPAICLVKSAKERGMEVTCETCPHFLYFTDKGVRNGDTRLKNFPPIRNSVNCNYIWELMKMNAIDSIGSQHVPISEQFKCRPSFSKAVSGINGLGFTLQVLWTTLKKPLTDIGNFEHYLVRMAKWTAGNPAIVLGLGKRGAIQKGYFADLIVWDPFQMEMVTRTYSSQPHQCPYIGEELYGHIEQVFVRGRLAYQSGEFAAIGRRVTS